MNIAKPVAFLIDSTWLVISSAFGAIPRVLILRVSGAIRISPRVLHFLWHSTINSSATK